MTKDPEDWGTIPTYLKDDEQFVYRYSPNKHGYGLRMVEDLEGEYIKYEYHKDVVVAGLLELVHARDAVVDSQAIRIKELEAQVKSSYKEGRRDAKWSHLI